MKGATVEVESMSINLDRTVVTVSLEIVMEAVKDGKSVDVNHIAQTLARDVEDMLDERSD